MQHLIVPGYDLEFKLFCKHRGINVHASLFKLKFNEPQNFSKYRQTEVDGATLGVYAQVAEIPHISKRFGLKRYLGWTEEEILENEKSWAEENAARVKEAEEAEGQAVVPAGDEGTGFGDVGASAAGLEGGEPSEELEGGEEDEIESGLEGLESPISGGENAAKEDDEEEEL